MADIIMTVDAAVTVPVNLMPLIDDTDFKTREVALTYDQAGMDLVWNFVTIAGVITQTAVTPTVAGNYDWTHVGDGMYKIEIPAAGGASINNDTEGFGWFTGYCTGVLPWRGPIIQFSPTNISTSLVTGANLLDVDVNTIVNNAITAASINAGAIDADALATDAVAEIADGVWDEILTTATHNIATSAGRRVRELAGLAVYAETATSGTATTITFPLGASTTNHIYNQNLIVITNGTGVGQCRMITEYVGGVTRTATVDRTWEVNPAADSEFQIVGFSGILITGHGVAQAGAAGSITLSAASIAVNDAYNGSMVVITTGTGAGQARLITDYDGGTFIALVAPNWTTNPDATSVYKIIPVGRAIVEDISATATTAITDDIMAYDLENSKTLAQVFRKMLSSVGNKTQDAETGTISFYDDLGTTVRFTAECDAYGNRDVITNLDLDY